VRRRETAGPPPALLTFDAADWPGQVQEAFALWLEARRAWGVEHGELLDEIDEARQTPDEPWDPDAI
jgi:hypothetical protein